MSDLNPMREPERWNHLVALMEDYVFARKHKTVEFPQMNRAIQEHGFTDRDVRGALWHCVDQGILDFTRDGKFALGRTQ